MISDKFLIEEKKLLNQKKIEVLKRIRNIKSYITPHFFYKNKNITANLNGKIDFKLDRNSFDYISFMEQNLDYNICPQLNILNCIDGENQISIDIEKQGIVEAKLIRYIDSKKDTIINLKLNKVNNISKCEGATYRLVFRVKEKGSFKVNSIIVDNKLLYGKISEELLDKDGMALGWSKSIKSSINIQGNKIIYNNLDKHEYIYFGNSEYINFNLNENTKIEFMATKSDDLDVELHITSHEENGTKITHNILKVNTTEYINIDCKNKIKIGIRLKGKGSCIINKIAINNQELWQSEDIIKELKDMYVQCDDDNAEVYLNNTIDVLNNKYLTYNPLMKIYKSYLKGNQYSYINIFSKDINVKKQTYLEVKLNSIKNNSLKIDGIIKITKNNGTYQYVQLLNNDDIIKIDEQTSSIEGFARIQKEGIFKNIAFIIKEYNYQPNNILELNLSKENWFNNFKKDLEITTKENLDINLKTNDGRVRYVSYLENNNSFNLSPKHNIMPIKDNMIYNIEPRVNSDEELNIHIMIIFYNKAQKLSVFQLINNTINKIHPPKGSTDFRIAMRINGSGKGRVSQILISEFEKINYNTLVSIIDKSELNYLNAQKPKKIKDFNMAVIMDEFTTASYENECNLIKLSPTSWKQELIQNDVDLLFVESAWKGNGGIWFKKVGDFGYENNKELFDIIEWCNLNNIPTVFWNKEDPVHFERFIQIAKRFDLILTTDRNSVPNYKKYAADKIIDALPFAAQPVKNNPIKLFNNRIEKACFAGSYYKLHEERAKDTEIILDEVAEFGLDIYDRNYEASKKGTMPNHTFPDRFKQYIRGSLKYNEIDKAYKGYKLMVNLNTVKHSPTMFARRVYEGLACGTPVISNYSQGIKEIFGDLVYIVENKGDMRDSIQKLMTDDTYYAHVQMNGMREVFEKHTYKDRLKFILDKLELRYEDKETEITLVATISSKEEFKKILSIYNKQSYKSKKLVVIMSKFDGYIEIFKQYNTKDISVYVKSYMHNYNNISEFIKTDYIGFISSNKFYGENYLRDLANTTKYTDSHIIGKSAYYTIENKKIKLINSENEFIYTNNVNIYASIIKPSVFNYDEVNSILDNLQKLDLSVYTRRGNTIFSTDKYNFIDTSFNLNKKIIESVEI